MKLFDTNECLKVNTRQLRVVPAINKYRVIKIAPSKFSTVEKDVTDSTNHLCNNSLLGYLQSNNE